MKLTLKPRKSTVTAAGSFRAKALDKLIEQVHLDREVLVQLEDQIYQLAQDHVQKQPTSVPKDQAIKRLYLGRIRHLIANLNPASYVANLELIEQLKNNQISIDTLLKMTPRQMKPSMWHRYEQREQAEIGEIAKGKLVATTSLFTCARCKSKRCTYFQMQTRSADEGITNFITCMDCGKEWRQYN